jgi:hypothetical protein
MIDLSTRAIVATVSSCSCGTKTMELECHDPLCRFRVIMELVGEINRLHDGVEEIRDSAKWDQSHHYPIGHELLIKRCEELLEK